MEKLFEARYKIAETGKMDFNPWSVKQVLNAKFLPRRWNTLFLFSVGN